MHVVVPKEASTCRLKGPEGEWIERTYDYVLACNSLKRRISQMKDVEDFESRPHKNSVIFWLIGKRRNRNGMSRSCQRCILATVEEGCQEEAKRKEAEKKKRKRRKAERDK